MCRTTRQNWNNGGESPYLFYYRRFYLPRIPYLNGDIVVKTKTKEETLLAELTPTWDPLKRGITWFWGLLQEGESGSQLWERLPNYDGKGYDIWTKVTSGKAARIICGRYKGNNVAVMRGVRCPLKGI